MLKKTIYIFIISCGTVLMLHAQTISRSSTGSGGGTLSNGTNMISFSIGGSVGGSLSGGTAMITQGFQQPGEELHTGPVADPVCAGAAINIPYTAVDIGGINTFTAQLSDESGSFSSPLVIGTAAGNESGIISGNIPSGMSAGTGYRIRVVSSYPPLNGTDNNSNIIVHTVVPVSISSVVNNTCHGGNTGSITAAAVGNPATAYTFSISGPTVNTTGALDGIFTGLTAGNYIITLTTTEGCGFVSMVNATVAEPTGTAPDISLGADYSANFFIAGNNDNDIIYNVSEIGGNPSTGDTLRIIKTAGFSFVFDPALSAITIGTTDYPLDNIRWKLDESNPAFVSLILDPAHNSTAGTLNCGERKYVALKLRRNTPNSSTFGLSSRLRRSDGEQKLGNNLNTIVFSAE